MPAATPDHKVQVKKANYQPPTITTRVVSASDPGSQDTKLDPQALHASTTTNKLETKTLEEINVLTMKRQRQILEAAKRDGSIVARDLALVIAFNICNRDLKIELLSRKIEDIDFDKYLTAAELLKPKKLKEEELAHAESTANDRMLVAFFLRNPDTQISLEDGNLCPNDIVIKRSELTTLEYEELRRRASGLKFDIEIHKITKPLHHTHSAIHRRIHQDLFNSNIPPDLKSQRFVLALELAAAMPELQKN